MPAIIPLLLCPFATKNRKMPQEPTLQENQIAKAIVHAAYTVHKALGPGLLESVYEICLGHELAKSGYQVRRQLGLPVHYDGIKVEAGLRLDLVVNNLVIVEVKAVEAMHPVFKAQLFTYLKLTERRLGLLINFNVEHIKEGIQRVVCSSQRSQEAKVVLPDFE
jgi:GxxExxY protein